MNGGLLPASYSLQGTFLDTRHAAYYGNIADGVNYLIVDNTFQGSAQPNGQTVRVAYYAMAIIPGAQTSSSASVSIDGILLAAGLIFLFAMAVIAALLTITKSLKMKQSRWPFYDRHESDPLHQECRVNSFQKIRSPIASTFNPRRCSTYSGPCNRAMPSCNGIIAKEWEQCSKCVGRSTVPSCVLLNRELSSLSSSMAGIAG